MRTGVEFIWLVSCAVCALFGAACTAAPDGSGASASTVKDSAGVRIVLNNSPAWLEGEGWDVGELLTSIGLAEGPGEQQLYRVFDATRLGDGTVVVANSGTAELRFFDRKETFVRSVGRTGDGPGEFSQEHTIRALVRLPGDSLLTWDIYGQKYSLFDPAGEFVRAARLAISGRMYFWRGVFSDGSLLMALINPDDQGDVQTGSYPRRIRLFRFSMAGDFLGVFGEYEESEWHVTRQEQGGIFMETPFARQVTLRVAGDQVLIATGDSYEFSVHDREFSPSMVVRREFVPVPITEADRARFLDEELDGVPATRLPALRRALESLPLPGFFPSYEAMVVDADLNVWLQEYPTRPGLPNDWSVFDPSGRWLGKVTLPNDFEVYEIGSDYLVGKAVDDLGIERVRVYRLIKEEELREKDS